jgi:uncharacterized surface protein with fasciclin (FAS1) repeats
MKIKKFITLLLMVSLVTTYSCVNSKEKKEVEVETEMEMETQEEEEIEEVGTIVEVAVSNDNFTTLVAAVKAADLVATLSSEGPFTVFAPVNAAFEKLPEGTVETLLKPENKEMLTAILTYHVVSGEFNAEAVIGAINDNNGKFEIKTVQGEMLTASLVDGKVILTDATGNTATVVMTDVEASNGIIHAIDTVVMSK